MKLDIIALSLTLAPLVVGHGAVISYIVGGKNYPGYAGLTPSTSPPTIRRQLKPYDPVIPASSPLILYNSSTSAKLNAPVNARENVTAV